MWAVCSKLRRRALETTTCNNIQFPPLLYLQYCTPPLFLSLLPSFQNVTTHLRSLYDAPSSSPAPKQAAVVVAAFLFCVPSKLAHMCAQRGEEAWGRPILIAERRKSMPDGGTVSKQHCGCTIRSHSKRLSNQNISFSLPFCGV